jgi:hypothetical protein
VARLQRTPLGYYAELEAKRFSRSELHEFLTIWFPRTAAFAVMRGGGLGAGVTQDARMDLVGTFYVRLELKDKKRWDSFFNGDGNMFERAIKVGLTKAGLYDWKDRTMEDLGREFDEAFPADTSNASGMDA